MFGEAPSFPLPSACSRFPHRSRLAAWKPRSHAAVTVRRTSLFDTLSSGHRRHHHHHHHHRALAVLSIDSASLRVTLHKTRTARLSLNSVCHAKHPTLQKSTSSVAGHSGDLEWSTSRPQHQHQHAVAARIDGVSNPFSHPSSLLPLTIRLRHTQTQTGTRFPNQIYPTPPACHIRASPQRRSRHSVHSASPFHDPVQHLCIDSFHPRRPSRTAPHLHRQNGRPLLQTRSHRL